MPFLAKIKHNFKTIFFSIIATSVLVIISIYIKFHNGSSNLPFHSFISNLSGLNSEIDTNSLACITINILGLWYGVLSYIKNFTKKNDHHLLSSIIYTSYSVFILLIIIYLTSFSNKLIYFFLATTMTALSWPLLVSIFNLDLDYKFFLTKTIIPTVIVAGSLIGANFVANFNIDNRIIEFKDMKGLNKFSKEGYNFELTSEVKDYFNELEQEVKSRNRPESDIWIVGSTDPQWYSKNHKAFSINHIDTYTKVNPQNKKCAFHSNVDLGFLRAFAVRQKLIENTDIENYVSKIIISSTGDHFFKEHNAKMQPYSVEDAKKAHFNGNDQELRMVNIYIHEKLP